jgi:hypothetical protein
VTADKNPGGEKVLGTDSGLTHAMHVGYPDRSPFAIHSCYTAPTPSGFAEIVGDDFPIFHLMSNVAPLTEQLAWFYFFVGASEATIFSKRGSPRSGSQNGSSFKAAYTLYMKVALPFSVRFCLCLDDVGIGTDAIAVVRS